MANSFKLVPKANVGTTPESIVTPIAGSTITIIGMSIANTTVSTSVAVNVMVRRGGVDYYVVKSAPVVPGGSLIVVGGEQKLVLEVGDTLYAVSSVASSVDVLTSYLSIS